MRGVNRAIILGTLGNDPDVKYTSSGAAVVSVSVATSEKWKDKNSGQDVEKTEWHKITMFGKLGEIAAQYLKKGSQAYFEGKIQTDKYDKNGVDTYSTKIIANVMQMTGSKPEGAQGQQPTQNAAPKQSGIGEPDGGFNKPRQDATPADDGLEDIPFIDPYKFNWRVV